MYPKTERTTPRANPPAHPAITFVSSPESTLPSLAKTEAKTCLAQPDRFASARAAMMNATTPTMQFRIVDVPARKL